MYTRIIMFSVFGGLFSSLFLYHVSFRLESATFRRQIEIFTVSIAKTFMYKKNSYKKTDVNNSKLTTI